MLQEGYLLLELLRVIGERVGHHHILFFTSRDSFSLVVEEFVVVRVNDNLGGVVEENTSRIVGEQIPKSILRGVVHPFLYPAVRPLDCLLLFSADGGKRF